jgi:hypothetical protein
MRSLRCSAAASSLLAVYYTDTDLSWAWRAAGSASSRESLPKPERLQRWCRVYTHKVYKIGSAIAAGGRVRARRHHAACCRQVDRRGGCKGRKSEQQASKPSRCCAASLYSSQQMRKAGNAETEFCGCCVDLPCARRRTSKWPSYGAWCYGWRAAVRSGQTVREEGQRR